MFPFKLFIELVKVSFFREYIFAYLFQDDLRCFERVSKNSNEFIIPLYSEQLKKGMW